MGKLSALRVDLKKANGGVWQELEAGIEFLIAKKPNDAYEDKLAVLSEPYSDEIRARTLSPELDKELTLRAIVGTVLLDWRNVDDDEGNPIEFTEDKAFEILKDSQYIDVYNWILLKAHAYHLYRVESKKAEAKNLSSA